jgi:hypothetical protein
MLIRRLEVARIDPGSPLTSIVRPTVRIVLACPDGHERQQRFLHPGQSINFFAPGTGAFEGMVADLDIPLPAPPPEETP